MAWPHRGRGPFPTETWGALHSSLRIAAERRRRRRFRVGGEGGGNAVLEGVALGLATDAVHQERERQLSRLGSRHPPREGCGTVERAGLGPQAALQRRSRVAVDQGPAHPGDRQAVDGGALTTRSEERRVGKGG